MCNTSYMNGRTLVSFHHNSAFHLRLLTYLKSHFSARRERLGLTSPLNSLDQNWERLQKVSGAKKEQSSMKSWNPNCWESKFPQRDGSRRNRFEIQRVEARIWNPGSWEPERGLGKWAQQVSSLILTFSCQSQWWMAKLASVKGCEESIPPGTEHPKGRGFVFFLSTITFLASDTVPLYTR